MTKHKYRIELCKSDGSTPLGEAVRVEVSASNYFEAYNIVLSAHPGHEVISWARVDEIDAYEERVRNGL